MERKYLRSIAILFCMSLAAVSARAASDEANIYFNAGTEKYLQGNFTESIENLEKAQDLDPSNRKIKEFMVKILLEAGTQNHLTRNYRQAFIYLEKAKKLDPENPKVIEMYQLTQGLLNPTAEKTVQKENIKQIQKNPDLKQNENVVEEASKAKQRQMIAAAQQTGAEKTRAPANFPKARVQREAGKSPLLFEPEKLEGWHILLFFSLLLCSLLGFVILFVMYIYKSREAANCRMQFIGMENDLKNAVEEKNSSKIEFEKTRERLKYEHEALETLQKSQKETAKKDDQKLKNEIDLKTTEIERRVRSEMMNKLKTDSGQKENFINHQQERFLKYISDTSVPAEADSDPVLASARERIALMAQNLYEYAPGAAVDFITKMAKNDNPAIRTNIVQALANIAKPETFELLFELYDDKDPGVKREVLRNLKALKQKILSGAIRLDINLEEKIKLLINEEKDRGEWIF